MSQPTLCRSDRSPATPAPFPATACSATSEVCQVIDTTTCIGCKACEVACMEWNDLPFQRDHLRQHLPDDAGDGVELLEPDQVQRARARGRHAAVADAQGPVHALRRAGLPARLPGRRRHRAVRQRHRRLPAGQVHRLRVLRDRLPVRHPEVQHARPRRSTSARSAPTASARGSSRPASRPARPAACTSAPRTTCGSWPTRARSNCASIGLRQRGRLRPAGVGGTHVIYVLHDITNPEAYGGLPEGSARPLDGPALEAAAQVARQPGDDRRPHRRLRALSALRAEGRREDEEEIREGKQP